MRRSVFGSFSLTCALACGEADFTSELAELEQPIVRGEQSDATEDATVYVVARTSPTEGTACTGTVVAPNLIATALHCVTQSTLGTFSCGTDGSLHSDNLSDGRLGAFVDASAVEIYTGVMPSREPSALGSKLIGTGSNQICRNDLAFVVLDRALDVPVASMRLNTTVRWGELLRVVGYGQTDVNGTAGRFTRSGVRVVDVGPVVDGEPSTAAPRTFVANEGPCHGDSGGPAFSTETGALLGVYSLTAGPSCSGVGIRNVYTHLSPFVTLVMDAFAEAGAEPLLEDDGSPEPSPSSGAEEGGCSLAATSSGATASLGWIVMACAALAGLARRRH